MATYLYPPNLELQRIDQTLMSELTLDDPIFEMFPIRESKDAMVQWEQKDSYSGLQQLRGYNGSPNSVPNIGSKRFMKLPGVFGEMDPIYELEITQRAAFASLDQPIDIGDLIAERQEKLMHRQVNRMRNILWTLVGTGVYQVLDKQGAVLEQDAYVPQSAPSAIPWSTSATATPLADFRAVQLLSRGQSVDFGPSAKAFMTQKTFNNFISNTNLNDLGGRRTEGLASIEGLADANKILLKDGLPQIVIWDKGWLADPVGGAASVFTLWIPDNRAIVVGSRQNKARIGEFLLTRSAQNKNGAATPYLRVIQRGFGDNEPPPAQVEVHRGFNGGPAVHYPGAVALMTGL